MSESGDRSLFLTFMLAGEPCALPVLRVVEVVECQPLTRVPTVPAYVRGIMNRRGQALPVVDLAMKFGLGQVPMGKRSCVVVTEIPVPDAEGGERTERITMGILTEEVDQVVDLGAADIEPPTPFGTALRVDLLTGLGRVGDRFLLLLDVDRVLSLEEGADLASAMAVPALPAAAEGGGGR